MYLAPPGANTVWSGVTVEQRRKLKFVPEQTLFPGLAVVVLSIVCLGSACTRGDCAGGCFAGVLLLAWLALGFHAGSFPWPYELVYHHLPGWESSRTPSRLNTLTSLGLALLAAGGATAVAARVRRPRARAALGALLVGARAARGRGVLVLGRWRAGPGAPDRPAGAGRPARPRYAPAPPADVARGQPPLRALVDRRLPADRERARELPAVAHDLDRHGCRCLPGRTLGSAAALAGSADGRAAPEPGAGHLVGGRRARSRSPASASRASAAATWWCSAWRPDALPGRAASLGNHRRRRADARPPPSHGDPADAGQPRRRERRDERRRPAVAAHTDAPAPSTHGTHAAATAQPTTASPARRSVSGHARHAAAWRRRRSPRPPPRTPAPARSPAQPCPAPSGVATVGSKFAAEISFAQKPTSSLPISGNVRVAVSMNSADGTARANVVTGKRLYASASGSARNGTSGMRKRGPGVPPPYGSQ